MRALKTLLTALAALAGACLIGSPAFAADNYTVTQGSGKTMACKDISTVCYITHTVGNAAGTVINPATSEQLGEVQASPTANTVLDRLKTVGTNTGTTATNTTRLAIGSTTSGQTGGLVLCAAVTAAPTTTTAQSYPCSLDVHGALRVLNMNSSGTPLDPTAALPAGTNIIGKVGIDQTTDKTTNHVDAGLSAATTGGCTPYGYQSAASTNSTNVKNAAGTLCSIGIINTTATLYYVRLYNAASAPTCSSATNFVATIPVPASATGAGTNPPLGTFGWNFSTGISFCLTGGGTSTDNTNAAVGVFLTASYK